MHQNRLKVIVNIFYKFIVVIYIVDIIIIVPNTNKKRFFDPVTLLCGILDPGWTEQIEHYTKYCKMRIPGISKYLINSVDKYRNRGQVDSTGTGWQDKKP